MEDLWFLAMQLVGLMCLLKLLEFLYSKITQIIGIPQKNDRGIGIKFIIK